MSNAALDQAMEVLFANARSHKQWTDEPVSENDLQALYNIMKWGPTSTNCCPIRIIFATSAAGKEKIAGIVSDNNKDKVRTAPVCAILAYDTEFHEHMDKLFKPGFKDMYAGNDALREITAFRNSTLQGAYFMIAARAVGLDCGPMSGFDNAACDQAFFPDGRLKSNFVCALGHGDPATLAPREYRFEFDEVCSMI